MLDRTQELTLPYVVKTSDVIESKGSELLLRERPMYGGENIVPDDDIFIWSSGKDGRLLGKGCVSHVSRDVIPYITLQIYELDWNVLGRITTKHLQPFRDIRDESPISEISRLLYKHAHNKIAYISEPASEFLKKYCINKSLTKSLNQSQTSQTPKSENKITLVFTIFIVFISVSALIYILSMQIFDKASSPKDRLNIESEITTKEVQNSVNTTSENLQGDYDIKTFLVAAKPGANSEPTNFRNLDVNDQQKAILKAEVVSAGYDCESVVSAYEIENTTDEHGLVRIECSNLNYQVVLLNGNSYVKPWTGVVFGPTD